MARSLFGWMRLNINLFCRRTHGRARAGDRAPASKRPNVHVVCAVPAYQMIHTMRRRGTFKSDAAKTWVLEMLEHLPPRARVYSVVLVYDIAPCHSKFEECVNDYQGLIVCRLGPYSPMLNPVETIWSKIKAVLKQRMRVPQAQSPGVGKWQLPYIEGLIDDAMGLITVQDIVNACQHAQGFSACAQLGGHGSGSINLWKCFIMLFILHIWFRLFCYDYLITVIFLFCVRKFVHWYALKCEILKFTCAILKCSWNYLKLIWITWNALKHFRNWADLSEIHLDIS